MLSSCTAKVYEKVDGHVKPANRHCKQGVKPGTAACGLCHAVKTSDGKLCRNPVEDARTHFCNTHRDFRGH